MRQYFEFSDEHVSCFCEITLEDKVIRTRYGQKGTHGAIIEKVFQDAISAAQEYERLVAQKKKDDPFYFNLGDFYLGDK